jgi:hypothetical protein
MTTELEAASTDLISLRMSGGAAGVGLLEADAGKALAHNRTQQTKTEKRKPVPRDRIRVNR